MELLAPAGDFEKLQIAINYGADAVYFSGKAFGLRSAAGNFSLKDLDKAVSFVKSRGKKLFLTVNTFPSQKDMDGIAKYFNMVKDFNIDALIVADVGVLLLAKQITKFPIHLSTQASTTNIYSTNFWKSQNVQRVIFAREISISEALYIKQKSNIEVEMFIHGSMCMAYSGKCTISNYTANRDANRGGCVNSCRWEYSLSNSYGEKLPSNLYIMNSKDLWAVKHIKSMIDAGIDSAKIEGRMKSALYLANCVSTYRKIIDYCLDGKTPDNFLINKWQNKLASVPNRHFSEGSLETKADKKSILYDNTKSNVKSNYIGVVLRVMDELILLQVKNPFSKGDYLKALLFDGEYVKFKVYEILDFTKAEIQKAQPNSLVYIKAINNIKSQNVITLDNQLQNNLLDNINLNNLVKSNNKAVCCK